MNNIFPISYLPYKDRTYAVLGYIGEVDDYKDNKGYIDRKTGKIYICSKNSEPVHQDVPILIVKDDAIEKKECNLTLSEECFKESKLYNLDYENIKNNTSPDKELYNEEALADMNAASSVFIPTINDDDDPLKKIIKQTIISKQIDINRLKHKMPQKYGLTNMKSALVGKTKMSIVNFNIWCELLGITYNITITDNGTDNQNPLNSILYYSSDNNRLTEERN